MFSCEQGARDILRAEQRPKGSVPTRSVQSPIPCGNAPRDVVQEWREAGGGMDVVFPASRYIVFG